MIIDHTLCDMIYDHHDFLEPYLWYDTESIQKIRRWSEPLTIL